MSEIARDLSRKSKKRERERLADHLCHSHRRNIHDQTKLPRPPPLLIPLVHPLSYTTENLPTPDIGYWSDQGNKTGDTAIQSGVSFLLVITGYTFNRILFLKSLNSLSSGLRLLLCGLCVFLTPVHIYACTSKYNRRVFTPWTLDSQKPKADTFGLLYSLLYI
ncbi:hypothetical protein NC651_010351 [Populus alba x Populus x berolinensis]|nr:hypothetical protein NC651_010351 [Populus alba x Populus x berolinensis]